VAQGKVVIVGAGPGDPELITVKGLKYLLQADVIVYDRLIPRELLDLAKPGAEKIYVGKEPGRHVMSQDEINRLLVRKAREGKLVVRLKGGDPYVFGRGEEECIFVQDHGVECEVVPGVPSFIGAAASACIPLTSRGVSSSFAVVTGREAEDKPRRGMVRLDEVAKSVDTVVVLMGATRSYEILNTIGRVVGYTKPAAAVINATMPSQEVIEGTIAELMQAAREGRIRNPAVIVVGDVVKLREKLCREPIRS
jgi:uroporphyrin-III C-methyltransferase